MKKICIIAAIVISLFSLTTCKKDKAPVPMEIKIHNVEPTAYSVHVDGVYIHDSEFKNFYVVYGRQSDLTDGESVKMELNEKKFSADVEGLKKNTKYYLCVECRTKYTSMRSEVKSFETANATQPEIKTNDITEITQTTAICGGNVTNDGGSEVTARGICWSKTQNPTIDNEHTTDGTGTGSFTSNLTELTPNTKYYIRSYATNREGISYGEEKSFTTLGDESTPTVTTNNVTAITTNSATCGGNVTDDGGASVTVKGICWNTLPNPTIEDEHTEDGSGTGSFVSYMTGLNHNTKYYVRAYATNRTGTAYGVQKEFTTDVNEEMPVVTTNNITAITINSATCGGNVTSDGNATVTARGICWSTSSNPTIEDEHTEDGSGIGSFVSYMTGLNHNTKYYVRAYATNEKGTAYGEQKEFTTLVNEVLPVVTTTNVTNITQTTATSGGNVTSDGNATVTARGVCWNTSPNPTIDNSHTTDGNGTGSFTSNLTGLTANTTYYVRAYATNNKGTSYGEEVSFKTLEIPSNNQLITVNGVSFTMIAVEGGTFQMGATSEQGSDAGSNESPVHSVTLSDYYIGETEVTQELWEAVMGSNPSQFSGYPQRPVEYVSWNDCQSFITKLNELTGKNFRLPTEAEWEYAARGGNESQGYKYSGGNTIDNVAWYTSNSGSRTHDVKTKSPNELGIYDMSGNVDEWCQDWYGDYSSSSQTNPTGPSSGSYRVVRGGSWCFNAGRCRVSSRSTFNSGNRYRYLGLRLCLSQY